jgi:DivIVA domain-containing protein
MPPSTPLDVQNKEFRRALRGYSIDEVDAFLDQVTVELDRLQGELKQGRTTGLTKPTSRRSPVRW